MVASHFIGQGYETRQILGLLQILSSLWSTKAPVAGRDPGPAPIRGHWTEGYLPTRRSSGESRSFCNRISSTTDGSPLRYIKVTHWLRQNLNVIINFKKAAAARSTGL